MSLGLVHNRTYRIYQVLLLIISFLFTGKCFQKFLLVRKEKNNPLNALKQLFWIFTILANGSYVIYFMVGVSNGHVIQTNFRCIAEIFEATPILFFYCILIATLIIIEESIKLAIGKRSTEIYWNTIFWLSTCPALLFFFHLHFIVWTFFTNVLLRNKEFIKTGEFEETYTLVAFYYTEGFYAIFSGILGVGGVLESILFLIIMCRLIPVLGTVYSLMNRSEKASRLKKTKLKEWTIFIFLCTFISILRLLVTFLALVDEKTPGSTKKWFLNPKTNTDLEFLKGKDEKDYKFIQHYDFARIVLMITIGVSSSFAAPCRRIKKD